MKKLIEKLRSAEDKRAVLLEIKEYVSAESGANELKSCDAETIGYLVSFLKAEDPKARRNAAKILSALKEDEITEKILQAYFEEKTLFIRADLLKAAGAGLLNKESDGNKMQTVASETLEVLRGCLENAEQCLLTDPDNKKHYTEEIRELRSILFAIDKPQMHTFAGENKALRLMLLTNQGAEKLLAENLKDLGYTNLRLMKGAVLAEKCQIKDILSVRTWRELLICPEEAKRVSKEDPEEAAKLIMQSDIPQMVGKLLDGPAPYYFRLDLKSRMSMEEKGRFAKKLSASLEQLSAGRFKNAAGSYEFEIRLTENKEGMLFPFLKFSVIDDKRFAYRKYAIAQSIAPVQAAICMELARGYLKEDARVLDPCCGCATMLLERNYVMHADTLYGTDIYGKALEGAKENAEIAGVPVHFVNRDFRSFSHEYRFDEIVTNFPTKGKTIDAHALDALYGKLLDKADEWLAEDGHLFVYTHDRGYLKKQLRMDPRWRASAEFNISAKEDTWFLIIERVVR